MPKLQTLMEVIVGLLLALLFYSLAFARDFRDRYNELVAVTPPPESRVSVIHDLTPEECVKAVAFLTQTSQYQHLNCLNFYKRKGDMDDTKRRASTRQ